MVVHTVQAVGCEPGACSSLGGPDAGRCVVTGFVFVAMWEITDRSVPEEMLQAQACAVLDAMAAARGARITGDPCWSNDGETLTCTVAARPWDIEFCWPDRPLVEPEPERPLATVVQINRRRSGGRPISPEKVAEIRRLASLHMGETAIAKALRIDRKTVRRYRREAA